MANKHVYYLQDDKLIKKQLCFPILKAVIYIIDSNGEIKESRLTPFGKQIFNGKFSHS